MMKFATALSIVLVGTVAAFAPPTSPRQHVSRSSSSSSSSSSPSVRDMSLRERERERERERGAICRWRIYIISSSLECRMMMTSIHFFVVDRRRMDVRRPGGWEEI